MCCSNLLLRKEFSVLRKIGDVRFTGQRVGNGHHKTLLLNFGKLSARQGGWEGGNQDQVGWWWWLHSCKGPRIDRHTHTLQFHGILSIYCQKKRSSLGRFLQVKYKKQYLSPIYEQNPRTRCILFYLKVEAKTSYLVRELVSIAAENLFSFSET